MPFLLTASPSPLESAPASMRGAAQSVRWGGVRLFHAARARVRELPANALGLDAPGPAWIAFEGHLAVSCRRAGTSSFATFVERVEDDPTGWSALAELHGSFVALVAVPAQRRCMLTCDRLGTRAGFYACKGRAVALASQAHLIALLPEFGTAEEPAWIASMFALRNDPPAGASPFASVRSLLPGERIEYAGQRLVRQARAAVAPAADVPADVGGWVEAFRTRFTRAVEDSFEVDERPFVMLSGGLDSGPTAAVAARKMARHGARLTAVSWRLRSFPGADESGYVERVARHIGARLLAFDADDLLPFSNLDARLVQPDQPSVHFYRDAITACYERARVAGHGVFLNGHAGDFLYPHPHWLLADQLRRGELRGAWAGVVEAAARSGVRSLHRHPPIRHALRRLLKGRRPPPSAPPAWLTESARAVWPHAGHGEAEAHPFPDYASRFLGTMLGKGTAFENTVAMRYGLERRDAFVDERLVRLALSMPFSLSYRNGTTKWVMRESARLEGWLPEAIRTKPRTGLLTEFLDAGFETNRNQIREFLFQGHDEWRQWLHAEPVERAVGDQQESFRDRAVAALAIGYCLWRQEIRRLQREADRPGTLPTTA